LIDQIEMKIIKKVG